MINDDAVSRLESREASHRHQEKLRLLIEEIEGEGWDCKVVDNDQTILVSQIKRRKFEHLASLNVAQVEVISAKKYASMFRQICERVSSQIDW